MISCEFENGDKTSLRHATVDVIVFNEDKTKVLLVKRAQKMTFEAGKWVVPGGYVDRDELVENAARREALEETGYELKSIQYIKFVDNPNRPGEDRQSIAFVYEAIAGDKVAEPDDESEDIRWFRLYELPTEKDFGFDHYEHLRKYITK